MWILELCLKNGKDKKGVLLKKLTKRRLELTEVI